MQCYFTPWSRVQFCCKTTALHVTYMRELYNSASGQNWKFTRVQQHVGWLSVACFPVCRKHTLCPNILPVLAGTSGYCIVDSYVTYVACRWWRESCDSLLLEGSGLSSEVCNSWLVSKHVSHTDFVLVVQANKQPVYWCTCTIIDNIPYIRF